MFTFCAPGRSNLHGSPAVAELKRLLGVHEPGDLRNLHGSPAVAELKLRCNGYFVGGVADLHGSPAVAELKPKKDEEDDGDVEENLHGSPAVAELKPGNPGRLARTG